MKRVQLRKKFGNVFAGEIAGYREEIADDLIASGSAYALDKNDQPIIPKEPGETKKTRRSRKSKSSDSKPEENKSNVNAEQLTPFTIDGISEATATALIESGLNTPEDVTAFLADSGDLSKIKGIPTADASAIVDLYAAENQE